MLLFLTSKLREAFNLVTFHSEDIEAFRNHRVSKHLNTYNSLDGKVEMNGKELWIMTKMFSVLWMINKKDLNISHVSLAKHG